MKSPRTDLAMESFGASGKSEMPGVQVSQWETGGVQLTEVVISDAGSAEELGKACGKYLTLESPLLRERDPETRMAMAALLGEELARLLPEDESAPVLVVGLGNRFITPDSLGALTVDRTLVTRHMTGSDFFRSDLRSVCAVAPGVLGVTGVETLEMVRSLTESVRPGAVICIDSLSARSSARIGSTLQLTDTGIQPGAGVGNLRQALSAETLGVPVVAVGMPTVIYAATLARDAFEALSAPDAPQDEAALDAMERELLSEDVGEMIVTPREIDALIVDAAGVIASGLNRALHPGLSDAEIAAMMD